MRYDDIEVFKSIYVDNQKIQVNNTKLIDRLENLSNNNLKVLVIGLILGGLIVWGYSYAVIRQLREQLQYERNLTVFKTKKELAQCKYTVLPALKGKVAYRIKINNHLFKANDIVNGWTFVAMSLPTNTAIFSRKMKNGLFDYAQILIDKKNGNRVMKNDS